MNRFLLFTNFNRNERRGIVVLLIILVVTLISRLIINYFPFSSDEEKVFLYKIIPNSVKADVHQHSDESLSQDNQSDIASNAFFHFNPNKASYNELRSLGFSTYNASNIIKYRDSGGGYYSENDLLRVYGIDSALVYLLSDYIIYNKKEAVALQVYKDKLPVVKSGGTEKVSVPLNSTDTSVLKKVRGIGDVFALRIIKYGQLLGGYTSVEQIKEVYGINNELYEQVSGYFYLDSISVKKIPINTAGYKELIRHPYLKVQHVKAILKYRELMGGFTDINQLKDSYICTLEEFKKISPYISVI